MTAFLVVAGVLCCGLAGLLLVRRARRSARPTAVTAVDPWAGLVRRACAEAHAIHTASSEPDTEELGSVEARLGVLVVNLRELEDTAPTEDLRAACHAVVKGARRLAVAVHAGGLLSTSGDAPNGPSGSRGDARFTAERTALEDAVYDLSWAVEYGPDALD